MNDDERFRAAIDRFDTENSRDPNVEQCEGAQVPKELLYARRMTQRLESFAPEAPQAVRLAARCQHIQRWQTPRSDYPAGREGYRRWRSDLAQFHADTAGRILQEVGYDASTIDRVRALLLKQRLKADPDCQVLEDVICLVFLEHYLSDFACRHDEAKLVNILRRTWKKMSARGHDAALDLDLPEDVGELLQKAVVTQ